MYCLSGGHDMLIILLKETDNISWQLHRQHICRTCTTVRHLSFGSSMVRAFHLSSQGCGFGPRLGLRNCFPEDNWSLTNVLRISESQAIST